MENFSSHRQHSSKSFEGKRAKTQWKKAAVAALALWASEAQAEQSFNTPEQRDLGTPETFNEWENLGEYATSLVHSRAYESGILQRDEVLFVHSVTGEILGGEAVPLTNAAGYTPYDMTVSYNEGSAVGIPGMWLQQERDRLSATYNVAGDEIEARHVYLDMRQYPEASTRLEVVLENALEPAAFDEQGRNRLQYLQEEFSLPEDIPAVVHQSLQAVLPGLAAEESRFNPNVTSVAGAAGVLQTMEETQRDTEELLGQSINPRLLVQQLPVAEYQLATSYRHLAQSLETELQMITLEFFEGDTEQMLRHFMVPLIINAYNAGQGRMTNVVQEFLAIHGSRTQVEAIRGGAVSGHDLFFVMAQTVAAENLVSGYGEHASTYVEKVLGFDAALEALAAEWYVRDVHVATEAAGNQSVVPPDQRG